MRVLHMVYHLEVKQCTIHGNFPYKSQTNLATSECDVIATDDRISDH